MIYCLGLIMFPVVQMAEVLLWVISQYDGINSQLLRQGMRVILTGKMTACSPTQACLFCVFLLHLWPYTQFFKCFQTIFSLVKLRRTCCQWFKTINIITVLTEMGSIDNQLVKGKKRVGSSHCLTGLVTD